MSAISGEELAAVAAALNVMMQPEEPAPERPSAWKLAMRRESVTPFDE
jgi:hypothetical protein